MPTRLPGGHTARSARKRTERDKTHEGRIRRRDHAAPPRIRRAERRGKRRDYARAAGRLRRSAERCYVPHAGKSGGAHARDTAARKGPSRTSAGCATDATGRRRWRGSGSAGAATRRCCRSRWRTTKRRGESRIRGAEMPHKVRGKKQRKKPHLHSIRENGKGR